MPEVRSEEWYVEQYNRNREQSDWVSSYQELVKLMEAIKLRDNINK